MRVSKSSMFAGLVVAYLMLFEWKVFNADSLRPFVDAAKFAIPVLLFLLVPLRKPRTRWAALYFALSAAFLAWGLVPCFFSPKYSETLVQWLKFVPRLLVAALVAGYLVLRPQATIKIFKLLVIIGALAMVQFAVLLPVFLFELAPGFEIPGVNGVFYGPFGLLGDQASQVKWWSSAYLPVPRLTGFWPEPSNASGFLVAAFFLAQAVYAAEGRQRWRWLSYLCLLGGFAGLAGAGYVALAASAMWGVLIVRKRPGRRWSGALVGALAIGLVVFAVGGRLIPRDYLEDRPLLRAAAGVRTQDEQDVEELYGGRLELLSQNVQVWKEEPFGVGFRIPGKGFFDEASASAPVLWLTYSGLVGLLILLGVQACVFQAALSQSRRSAVSARVAQAFVALFAQHLSHGTWMSPLYIVLCVVVVLGGRAWAPATPAVDQPDLEPWPQPV
jgi:hypothetical protein